MTQPELIELLCCPETHQDLRLADPALVERLNQAIASELQINRAGKPVRDRIDGGLLRADGRFLYPIRRGVPALLIDESIPVGQP